MAMKYDPRHIAWGTLQARMARKRENIKALTAAHSSHVTRVADITAQHERLVELQETYTRAHSFPNSQEPDERWQRLQNRQRLSLKAAQQDVRAAEARLEAASADEIQARYDIGTLRRRLEYLEVMEAGAREDIEILERRGWGEGKVEEEDDDENNSSDNEDAVKCNDKKIFAAWDLHKLETMVVMESRADRAVAQSEIFGGINAWKMEFGRKTGGGGDEDLGPLSPTGVSECGVEY